MRTRKIQRLRDKYAFITIPTPLMEDLEWQIGQNVEFKRQGDSILMSMPDNFGRK